MNLQHRALPSKPGADQEPKQLDRLAEGIEKALTALGVGFLRCPENDSLRQALASGRLCEQAYLNQLLCVVYRLLFLFLAEDRDLLFGPNTTEEIRSKYRQSHGARELCEGNSSGVWGKIVFIFQRVADSRGCPEFGLPHLGGYLFDPDSTQDLNACGIVDRDLIQGIRSLSFLDKERVDYRKIGFEELGSIYESLLELECKADVKSGSFVLETASSHARRATGSYYTPSAVVSTLLDRTLEPLLDEAMTSRDPEASLLGLRVCDPACGSGHFLLAAAHRMAHRLAAFRSEGADCSEIHRQALGDVVLRCLYGVDVNPLALELCKASLWAAAHQPGLSLTSFSQRLRVGNALLGATPALLRRGIPDEAYRAVGDDDKLIAKHLTRDRKQDREGQLSLLIQSRHEPWEFEAANEFCAAFLLPKTKGIGLSQHDEVSLVCRQHRVFHWFLAFPDIFRPAYEDADNPITGWDGGFDAVIGNPPWIAHAGRASQPLDAHVKNFYDACNPAFAGYKTTHGMFVYLGASLLRLGGHLGLVVPTSISDLDRYAPVRRAHAQLCEPESCLPDFGNVFPGVFQPCMGLVSNRRNPSEGQPNDDRLWDLERRDLSIDARRLLEELSLLPSLPSELFGERGFQTSALLRQAISKTGAPEGSFTLALREGTDIREFARLAPRIFGDPDRLKLRSAQEYDKVAILIRQTARYPIATSSDGLAFRNSILAGFETEEWPRELLLCLLNSTLVRWYHYTRFRDARQGMPQVKIGHLRRIPAPPRMTKESRNTLIELGRRLVLRNTGIEEQERSQLDALVFEAYGIGERDRSWLVGWTV